MNSAPNVTGPAVSGQLAPAASPIPDGARLQRDPADNWPATLRDLDELERAGLLPPGYPRTTLGGILAEALPSLSREA